MRPNTSVLESVSSANLPLLNRQHGHLPQNEKEARRGRRGGKREIGKRARTGRAGKEKGREEEGNGCRDGSPWP